MIKKILASVLLLAVLATGIWAIVRSNSHTQSGLAVTASYYPLYDFAKQVGGDKIQLRNVTPAGTEPHDFEPSAKDLAQAQAAKIFIYNGTALEPWADKFVKQYKGQTVTASEGVALLKPTVDTAEKTLNYDPHFWLDPIAAKHIVDHIAKALSSADPTNRDYYLGNARAYKTKLDQLDTAYRYGLRDCRQRTVVVSHQSMGYVAARYHLQVESVAGLSPDSEPSAARLADLTKLVRDKNIQYIFFESLVSPRLADTIASETGAKTLVLDPIEGLTDEAQKDGKNYLSLQRENLANLRLALACH
jgi:zinc transport system substrate-binding protein